MADVAGSAKDSDNKKLEMGLHMGLCVEVWQGGSRHSQAPPDVDTLGTA